MFDWDDEERWRFRGRMSGREAPNHNSSYSAFSTRGNAGSWSKHGRSSGAHTSKPSRYAQRAIVQREIKYANSSGGLGTERHLTYIQRDGTGRDGESPELFGPEREDIDRDDFLERSRDDEHQFRIVVSPERGHDLDLENYVHDWMDHLEDDLEHDLDWAAAVHHNTDNPHAHIIIRGRDHDGDKVFMSPDYLNNGLRYRAQEVATYHLGPRTPSQMQRAFEKQTDRDHFTELDGALLAESNDRNELHLDDIQPQKPGLRHTHLARRLQHLRQLNLARQRDGGTWNLHADLHDRLDELARQKDILRRLHEAGRDNPDRHATSLPHDRLVGRVVDRGVADELDDQPYVIVDGEDGHSRYVEPDGTRPPASGDLVSLRKKHGNLDIEPIDDDLEEADRANGPTWLDRRLHSNVDHAGESELGDALHEATERRRRVLIRRGLLKRNEETPRDLVKSLRDYERDQFAQSLADQEDRRVRQLSEDGKSITGELSDRKELRGGDVFVVRNRRELAVVPANKYLDNHAQSRVRLERSKNKRGRLRTFVEKASDKSLDR